MRTPALLTPLALGTKFWRSCAPAHYPLGHPQLASLQSSSLLPAPVQTSQWLPRLLNTGPTSPQPVSSGCSSRKDLIPVLPIVHTWLPSSAPPKTVLACPATLPSETWGPVVRSLCCLPQPNTSLYTGHSVPTRTEGAIRAGLWHRSIHTT